MPDVDGYEVCRRLKRNPKVNKIPVIFVTARGESEDESLGFQVGAVDYIIKPFSPPIVKERIKIHLRLQNQNRVLEEKVRQRTMELHDTQLEVIRSLGMAAEYKDNETGLHVIRMSHYAAIIGRAMGKSEVECDLILNAMPMHDVGKIGIPDNVLLKAGKLDSEEWDIIKKHPEIGAKIIGTHNDPLLHMAREVALTHHEKWNGKGYPNGLAGKDIPLSGRICAVADVFDALTTERPYKKAWSVPEALDFLQQGS